MSCNTNEAVSINRFVKVSTSLTTDTVGNSLNIAIALTTEGEQTVQNRLQYYTSSSEILDEYGSSSEVYKVAKAYFSQSPSTGTLATGKIFLTDQSATLTSDTVASLTTLQGVTNGAFRINISGDFFEFTDLDFSTANTFEEIGNIIQNRFGEIVNTLGAGGYEPASADIGLIDNSTRLRVIAGNTGNISTISALSDLESDPVDITGVDYLNGADGVNAAGSVANFQAVTNGVLSVTYNGVTRQVRNIDFSSAVDYSDIAFTLDDYIKKYTLEGFINSEAQIVDLGGGEVSFIIQNGTLTATVSSPGVQTYIGGEDFLNASDNATLSQGYEAGTIIEQVQQIKDLTTCPSNPYIYCWGFTSELATQQNQIDLASWGSAIDKTLILIESTDGNIVNPNSNVDISSIIAATNNSRASGFYSDGSAIQYAMFAILSRMMGVNLSTQQITQSQFKTLSEIVTLENASESVLNTLDSKSTNRYILMQTNNQIFDGGYTYNKEWNIRNRYGLDNFQNDIENSLFNVLYTSSNTNKDLRTDVVGIIKLKQAITNVCLKYVNNSFLESKSKADSTSENGIVNIPAYKITSISIAPIAEKPSFVEVSVNLELNLTLLVGIIQLTVNAISQT